MKWFLKTHYFTAGLLLLCIGLSHGQNISDGSPTISREYFEVLMDSSDTYYFNGDYKESLKLNISLLGQAVKLNDPYLIYRGYRNLGYDYLAITDTVLAQENFQKSQKFAQLSKNDTAIALNYMDLANMFAATGKDYALAFTYHNKSIEGFEKIKDSAKLANAHYNTILTAMESGNYPKAFTHIQAAKLLSKHYNHDSYQTGLDNIMLEYYYIKGDFKNADFYAQKVIQEATLADLWIELETAYLFYSQSLFAQEKFKEAYQVRAKYEEYQAKNLENIKSAETDMMAAKFQVEEYKKDMEAAELEQQFQMTIVANKSRWNNYLLVVSAICLLTIMLLIYAFRNRKKLVKELKIKNKEYLNAKDESERMSKAKTKFFSTVSHELRTPLYGVIGLSTLLLEDKALKNHKKDLNLLKFSADYLLALINDVLQINKIDSKTLENDCSTFNVRELINTIAASFEYMRVQNNNKINIQIDTEIPTSIKGNAMRLSQILMNLIGNACKFTENGKIQINIVQQKSSDNKIELGFSIKDNGIGIAKEKQDIIFDEFSQIDSRNYSYQGTGLGLPIVKKLLNLSNSDIAVSSVLGQGSEFKFALEFTRVNNIPQVESDTLLDAKLLRGKRILVVEDNRINQIVTKKILEKDMVECVLADNGEQAVTLARKLKFDLILMDINMPEKDGIQATKEIRQFNPNIPVIALTAVEIEEVRFGIFDAGMNDIIVKPYDITKFKQTILKNIFITGIKQGVNAHLKAM